MEARPLDIMDVSLTRFNSPFSHGVVDARPRCPPACTPARICGFNRAAPSLTMVFFGHGSRKWGCCERHIAHLFIFLSSTFLVLYYTILITVTLGALLS
jgi:hypothetical protein